MLHGQPGLQRRVHRVLRQTIHQVRGAAAAVRHVHVLRAVDRRLHGRQRRLLRPGEAVAEYRRQHADRVAWIVFVDRGSVVDEVAVGI